MRCGEQGRRHGFESGGTDFASENIEQGPSDLSESRLRLSLVQSHLFNY